MTSRELENLAIIGQLKRTDSSNTEIDAIRDALRRQAASAKD